MGVIAGCVFHRLSEFWVVNAFPDPVSDHPDDLVIDVEIKMSTGAGGEIGRVKRHIVVPIAFAPMLLNRAEGSAISAIDREVLLKVRHFVIKEMERRTPEAFFRSLGTLHPDWMLPPDHEEARRFAQFADHAVREFEIAAED